MSDVVLNLGMIRAVQYGTIAPLNLKMLWYDENTGVDCLKYYNKLTSTWDPLIVPSSSSIIQTTVDVTDVDVTVATLSSGVSYAGTLEIITDGNQVSVTFFTTLTVGPNTQGGFSIQIPSDKLPEPQIQSAYSNLLVIKNGNTYPVGASITSYNPDSFISLAFTYSTILDGFTSGSIQIVGTITYIKKQ